MEATPGSERTVPAGWWPAFAVPVLGAALSASGLVLAGGLRRDGTTEPEVVLGLVAAAVGAAVVLGWSITAGLAVLAVVAGRRRWGRLALVCRRCSPAVLRRAATVVLGLQLVGLPVASADEPPTPFWGGDDRTHASRLPEPPAQQTGDALADTPPPGRAAGAAMIPPGPPDTATPVGPAPVPSLSGRTVDGEVTVLHGDTLWSLAAAHLGPGATDAQIAHCWPVWYELNRHVLLDGPHVLLPGQRLVVPATDAGAARPPSTPFPSIPGGPS